jgi:hypothetical protein
LLTRVTRIFHKRVFTKTAHDGPREIPLRAFYRALVIREKKTDAPPFSCFRPVIVLLFAAPASNKAHKYGAISAPACIFPCCLQGAAGATRELIARRLGNNGMGGAFAPL